MLSHEDSNLDRQNQNLLYYLYTMGQRSAKVTLFNKISNRSTDFLAVKDEIAENYILESAKVSATK